MVVHPTVIHLVATSQVPLLSLLSHALGSIAKVRWWTAVPAVAALRAGDLLVVDLLDGGRCIQPAAVARMSTRARALLVAGSTPIASEWLEVSGQERVHVVRCPGCSSSERFVKLVAAVESDLSRPTGAEIADQVLRREARFAAVAHIVRVICEHPWETRRPVDLATRARMGLPGLKRAVGDLGFRRVEHFIVAVRLVAFEELVTRHRMSPQTARRIVGLIDPSNVSRQLRRAWVGSPGAFRDLAVSRP